MERSRRPAADMALAIVVTIALAGALAPLGLWSVELGEWPDDPMPLARAFGRGLAIGLGVAAIALAVAWPIARAVPTVALLGWALVGSLPRSLGALALGLPPGVAAVTVALLAGAVPWTALLVQVRMSSRPRAWIEAAADLGASPWQRFLRIDLPFARPALAIAATWTVLQSLGDATTYELAGGGKVYTPALLLRDALLEDDDAALVSIALAVSTAAALPAAWALTAVLGRALAGAREAIIAPTPRLRAIGLALAALAALPIAALVVPALAPLGAGDAVLAGKLVPTFAVVVLSAGVGTAIGATCAIGMRRGGALVFSLLLLPAVLPPIVYGVTALELGDRWGLGPGLALTVLALVPTCVALAFTVLVVARPRVPAVLVEAAADLGAGTLARVHRIWAPLLGPAVVAALVLAGAWAINDAALVAFTSGPGGSTLAVAMTVVARGAQSAVVPRWALVQVAVAVLAVALARWLLARRSVS
jgi:ABC-type spermidine/putrescine transport system permease subunit II